MSKIPRWMAAGPWVTRDLKEAVLAADYDALSEKLSNALCTNYDLRKERDRLTDELAARSCTGPAHICHNLATERSENARLRKEIEQYETVIIPSWKREEEMWREDEANAIEFRRVLAEELDKRDADIARLRAWLRDYQPRPTVQPSPGRWFCERHGVYAGPVCTKCDEEIVRTADSADASLYQRWKCPHCGWDNVDSVCFACKRSPGCDHLWSADESDGVLFCLKCGHKEPK